jgi:hypothetical protein
MISAMAPKAEPRQHERGYDDGADRNKHGRDCG